MIFKPSLVNRPYLFKQDNRIPVKPLNIFYLSVCWQFRLCLCLARDSGNNYCRAVPVACIIRNDKYGSCSALLRANNRIKLCIVDIATLKNSIYSI